MSNGVAKVGNKSGICNSNGQDFFDELLDHRLLSTAVYLPLPHLGG